MKATIGGQLSEIPDCFIKIPGAGDIRLNNLPDITDGKNAIYNNEPIMGRSFPLYTYSHSGDRTIGMTLHFFIVNPGDGARNLSYLRKLQSALYPRDGSNSGTPYQPPPICQVKCGKLLGTQDLCVVLQSYNVKFPTEVAWDEETYCPFRFDVETTWLTVYTTTDLPFQDRIVSSGR